MCDTNTKLPKKSDPLTVEEMTNAADEFLALFNVVSDRMPAKASIEDTLKVMESVAKLGHQKRAEKLSKQHAERFGFNKENESDEANDV